MIIAIIIIFILMILMFFKDNKIDELQDKLSIRESENRCLKRVLAENDLIPEEFVK